MKTKKILSLLLAGLLALSVAACGQQTTVTNNDQGSSSEVTSDVTSDTEVGETGDRPTEPTGQLVIGALTPVDNDFYDPSFKQQRHQHEHVQPDPRLRRCCLHQGRPV